jgi:BASS family bile acid:Na+ symporter
VRIASVVILTLVIIGAVSAQLDVLMANLGALAGVVVTFCVLSLAIGFIVPRLLKIDRPQSVASAFEVGLHNATLAIVIARSVLQNADMSLPAAVYGVLMFPLAAAFGMLITRGAPKTPH